MVLSAPQAVKDYVQPVLGTKEHEVFLVLLLDAQNRLLASEEVFRGTLTKASFYPRKVAKPTLAYTTASVILAHNHPFGVAAPSVADETLPPCAAMYARADRCAGAGPFCRSKKSNLLLHRSWSFISQPESRLKC